MPLRATLLVALAACRGASPPPTTDTGTTEDDTGSITVDTGIEDTGESSTSFVAQSTWEQDRRQALAGCTAMFRLPLQPTWETTTYDAYGWPVTVIGPPSTYPKAETQIVYQRVGDALVSSERTFHVGGPPTCGGAPRFLTNATYDRAERMTHYDQVHTDAYCDVSQSNASYTYTAQDGLLVESVELLNGVTETTTYDACGLPTQQGTTEYTNVYDNECDVVRIEEKYVTTEWELQRPVRRIEPDGDVVGTWTYAGCADGNNIGPPIDEREGWSYAIDLSGGTWSPPWMADVLDATPPSFLPLVVSLKVVTPDQLLLTLEENTERSCRVAADLLATTWSDPSFEVVNGYNLSQIDITDGKDPLQRTFMLESDGVDTRSIATTLSGTVATDGSEIEGLTMSMLVNTEQMEWTGLGDTDSICARAALEGTSCVPCGSYGKQCLPMAVAVAAPSGNAPHTPYDCE